MKVVVLDVSGRSPLLYNHYLCQALAEELGQENVTLVSTVKVKEGRHYSFRQLFRLVPDRFSSSKSRIKRMVRAAEVLVNYLYVFFYLLFSKFDVLHIEWLPFLEKSNLEYHFLTLLRKCKKGIRVCFTVHNVYPHNLAEANRGAYRNRFQRVASRIDAFLVHTQTSRQDLISGFGVEPERIFVAYHAIFVPLTIPSYTPEADDRFRILLFGYQSMYKGTDVFLQALNCLTPEQRNRIKVTIVGKTDQGLYEKYAGMADSFGVEWVNEYVSEPVLCRYIMASDALAFPYREISQSGALLLALHFRKAIIATDLPSFRETLIGFKDEWFCKPDDPQDLAGLIVRYAMGQIAFDDQREHIEYLNQLYSWPSMAKSTIKAYVTK